MATASLLHKPPHTEATGMALGKSEREWLSCLHLNFEQPNRSPPNHRHWTTPIEFSLKLANELHWQRLQPIYKQV